MTQAITKDGILEACAHACHEANRIYAFTIGDGYAQPAWSDVTEEIRDSARQGVRGVLFDGNGPRESHASWTEHKVKNGWSYGPLRDDVKKFHPCLLPYDDLPESQRRKDDLFISTARSMAAALGWSEFALRREGNPVIAL